MTRKKYLILKGKAGMGNRILSLLGAVLYAQLTGRELIVDWSDVGYSADRGNSFPRFFAAPGTARIEDIPADASVYPPLWKQHLRDSVDEVMGRYEPEDADNDPAVNRRYSVDFGDLYRPEDVVVRWSYTDELHRLRPRLRLRRELAELADRGDEEILRELLRSRVAPSAELRALLDAFTDQHFASVMVGIHVRSTDRKNSFLEYPALAERLLARHQDAAIFLATDNRQVEAFFAARFPRVITAPKWLPAPGEPVHRVDGCPDKTAMGFEALMDLFLLGRCDYLIYNKTTTFGHVASLLSHALPGNLIETSPFSLRDTLREVRNWLDARRPAASPAV